MQTANRHRNAAGGAQFSPDPSLAPKQRSWLRHRQPLVGSIGIGQAKVAGIWLGPLLAPSRADERTCVLDRRCCQSGAACGWWGLSSSAGGPGGVPAGASAAARPFAAAGTRWLECWATERGSSSGPARRRQPHVRDGASGAAQFGCAALTDRALVRGGRRSGQMELFRSTRVGRSLGATRWGRTGDHPGAHVDLALFTGIQAPGTGLPGGRAPESIGGRALRGLRSG